MGLDLQPDGLTAGLAGHCQPDKKNPQSQSTVKLLLVLKHCTAALPPGTS